MESEVKPAYYALPGGIWRDYITLLHLPYTMWHLSYVVLGAAAAPEVHLYRIGGLVLAFFLAVGLGAHALDEYRGRPLGTGIPDNRLLAIAILSLSAARGIRLVASLPLRLWAVHIRVLSGSAVP